MIVACVTVGVRVIVGFAAGTGEVAVGLAFTLLIDVVAIAIVVVPVVPMAAVIMVASNIEFDRRYAPSLQVPRGTG